MCGIAGLFAYHPDAPQPDPAEVRRMTDAMAARGPDGEGLWTSPEGRVAFGHRRLSILDLSEAGAQPMQSADGRLAITFNGEIYNHRALRHDMEQRGWRFRSTSDTEVLLALWDAHGPDMVHHLRGMFAFALWDARQQSLFLARDPFGIKPLYLADDGKTLRFASQVRALVAGGGVGDEPDLAGWAGFHLLGYVPEPHTIHRAIRALLPGRALRIHPDGSRTGTVHFDLTAELAAAQERTRSLPPAESRALFRETLGDSVGAHLVSDVPVGLFLSAGLDSSTLAGLAAERADGRLRAVTLGFQEFRGLAEDETALAALTAAHLGVDHDVRWITRADFRAHLEHALRSMDQPSIDGINTYFVSLAAAQAGMKVALSGLGGDELLAGYPSFRQVPRLARWLGPLARHLPALGPVLRRAAAPLLGQRFSPKYAGLLEYGGTVGGAYLLRRALHMPWELPALLGPEETAQGLEELDLPARLAASIQGLTGDRARLMALEMGWYMQGQLLKDTDWAAMAHGLEVRVPFVDVDLFRTLAPLQVGPAPLGKADLPEVPARGLPEAVRTRPKTGFTTPTRAWAEELHPARARGLRGWAELITQRQGGPSPALPTRPERRVLIFRLGSLGDTVVALPCFHLLARRFPGAERRVLTNMPGHQKAPPLQAVLGDTGLVHGYLEYPAHVAWWRKSGSLRQEIRAFRPDVLIYLAPARTPVQLLRDWLFFRLCGIRRIEGIPWRRRDRTCQRLGGGYEYEAQRLARCLGFLGDARLQAPASWSLRLQPGEMTRAEALLAPLPPGLPALALGVGTKIPVKEWGEANWKGLLQTLRATHGHWGLLLLGSAEERALSARVAEGWPGPVVNLCGDLSPRESAAALRRASRFLGQDSGPMHLAAAMGLPCVAIFSARDRPGVWFPYGEAHRVLYHDLPCANCKLEVCEAKAKACITSITVEEVAAAFRSAGLRPEPAGQAHP